MQPLGSASAGGVNAQEETRAAERIDSTLCSIILFQSVVCLVFNTVLWWWRAEKLQRGWNTVGGVESGRVTVILGGAQWCLTWHLRMGTVLDCTVKRPGDGMDEEASVEDDKCFGGARNIGGERG